VANGFNLIYIKLYLKNFLVLPDGKASVYEFFQLGGKHGE
jgi:hypothetical protein